MKYRFLLFLLLIMALSFVPVSGEEQDPFLFSWDSFIMGHTPGGEFFTSFLENYAPSTTLLIEESNGFALLDHPRVYFEGDSYTRFNWIYNSMSINSVLNPGAPAVVLPFSAVNGYTVRGESPTSPDYGFDFVSQMPERSFSRLTISPVYSNLGGYWAKFMIQPEHPTERADRLYTERRKITHQYYLDYFLSKVKKESQFVLALSYFDMARQFNDFTAYNETYTDAGKLATLNARFRKESKNNIFDLYSVLNYRERDHQLAELGVLPQETTQNKRWAFLTGLNLTLQKLAINLSVAVEKEDITPNVANFSKDLVDNDGDVLLPYGSVANQRLGAFTGTAINLKLNYPLTLHLPAHPLEMNTYAEMRFNRFQGQEKIHDYNTIFFAQTPYQVVVWNQGENYHNTNLEVKAGFHFTAHLNAHFALLAKVWYQLQQLRFNEQNNNISVSAPGFDAGLQLVFARAKRGRLQLLYGISPYTYTGDSNFFLETQRPYGTIYYWNDANHDGRYQTGETRGIYGYTGGLYHHLSADIAMPSYQRVELYFTTPISKYFSIDVNGLYKKFKNNPRISFADDYGFYENHDGQNLYFFTKPISDYYLSNAGYEKEPFYAQFFFRVHGERAQHWFFSVSFMAHMGMGVTAFGNGPASNDIGILDESQANPNSMINGFGRIDGERGFVFKNVFGYYLAKKLFLAVSLKYRDGNPFAFFNTVSAHQQHVIYYQTIKAENEKGIKGGPREDYVADISMKLQYDFKLFKQPASIGLSVFNIFDFGAELSEYVYSGGARDAMELQIPRSLRLTLNWEF